MIDIAVLLELIKNPKLIEKLKYDQISIILKEVKDIFANENLLLEFEMENYNEEVHVIGDIHGNLKSLMKLIEIINEKKPKYVIFLGDIVDRGPKQLECLIILLSLKILEPKRFFILRGNHEDIRMNQRYGFFDKYMSRFSDKSNFELILDVYDVLPVCCLVNNSILLLHGGIPRDIEILSKLRNLKPKDIISVFDSIAHSLIEIMWNDPDPGLKGFSESFRGPGISIFGEDVFDNFLKVNDLTYLVRGHECFPEGFRWFFNKRLLSIFSSDNYRGYFSPNPASYALIKNNEVIPQIINMSQD